MRKCFLCYGESADGARVCRWCKQELPPLVGVAPQSERNPPSRDSSILESYAQDFLMEVDRTDLQSEHLWQQRYADEAIAAEGRVYSCSKEGHLILLHVDIETSVKEIRLSMDLPLSCLDVALSLNKGDRVFVEGVIERPILHKVRANELSLLDAKMEKL